MLAARMKAFGTSGTARARAGALAARASGREVVDLTAGEIVCGLGAALREGALAAIERGANRYTDTIGLAELRREIARAVCARTGQMWTADEIAVTAGAKQALFNAAMTLLDPDDEVLIPTPYWTTFPAQVRIAGATPVFVDTRPSHYVPRLEDLRAAISPRTRAIIVNTPGNPTGAVYDRATLAGIAELALAHELWVIFDECYGAFTHGASVHENIVSVEPRMRPRAILIDSFSKQLGITGWRIGYVAAPASVINAIRALQSHTTSNPNVIGQHAVLEHLACADDAHERRLREQLAEARRVGLTILASLKGVPMPRAEGGFYFYLDVSRLLKERTVDDVAGILLAEAGVACVAGTAFGDPHGLRLSYGIPLETLERGLRRLVETLNALD